MTATLWEERDDPQSRSQVLVCKAGLGHVAWQPPAANSSHEPRGRYNSSLRRLSSPHASEGAERWVLWRLSTQDEPCLWANLLAVLLLLLIQNSYRML
jgi:hypothetical protein